MFANWRRPSRTWSRSARRAREPMLGILANHLWQSTVFAVAAGLFTVAFRKNRAQVRFGLWLCASFKFLVPFSPLMNLGSHWELRPAAKRATPPAVSAAMLQISQPFPEL